MVLPALLIVIITGIIITIIIAIQVVITVIVVVESISGPGAAINGGGKPAATDAHMQVQWYSIKDAKLLTACKQ